MVEGLTRLTTQNEELQKNMEMWKSSMEVRLLWMEKQCWCDSYYHREVARARVEELLSIMMVESVMRIIYGLNSIIINTGIRKDSVRGSKTLSRKDIKYMKANGVNFATHIVNWKTKDKKRNSFRTRPF